MKKMWVTFKMGVCIEGETWKECERKWKSMNIITEDMAKSSGKFVEMVSMQDANSCYEIADCAKADLEDIVEELSEKARKYGKTHFSLCNDEGELQKVGYFDQNGICYNYVNETDDEEIYLTWNDIVGNSDVDRYDELVAINNNVIRLK